jgi:DNA processing protein
MLRHSLAGVLDCCARDPARLIDLLDLQDDELISAIGGRRRQELRLLHRRLLRQAPPAAWRGALCRHDRRFPRALGGRGGPSVLALSCEPARLQRLTAGPVVAVAGSRRCSDYGAEVTRALARGLAAAGITVAAGLGDRLSHAAHEGVLQAGGASIAVAARGLGRAGPAAARGLLAGVRERGCVVCELPADAPARRWQAPAAQRTLIGLCSVLVVAEAQESGPDALAVRLARSQGCPLGAVPGRVGSPLSRWPHALLRDGARLVEGAADVLEMLHLAPLDERAPGAGADADCGGCGEQLDARLRGVLDEVSAGSGAPEEISCAGARDALLALSELELLGLVVRGSGGRYRRKL